jgi:hypothetical protein
MAKKAERIRAVEIAFFLRVILVARSGVVLRCIRAVVIAPHGDFGPTSVLTGTSRILQMNIMRREKEVGSWRYAYQKRIDAKHERYDSSRAAQGSTATLILL